MSVQKGSNLFYIICLAVLLVWPHSAEAAYISEGMYQGVQLRTGPGYEFPIRYTVDAENLEFTARYGNWVQVRMVGWMWIEVVDTSLPDFSYLDIPEGYNGLIIGLIPLEEENDNQGQ